MKRAALLCLVLLVSPLWGQSLKLPAEVKGETDDFITVKAETDCKEVRWVSMDAGLKLFPVDLLKDSKTAIVIAKKVGKYRLLAYTAKEDKPSDPVITTVIVGNPGPNPDPDPDPDPTPIDQDLLRALQAAYGREPADSRAKDTKELVDLYRASAAAVLASTLGTVLAYKDVIKASRVRLIGERLPSVRAEVNAYLAKSLPSETDAPLDQSNKTKFSQALAKLARALAEVK